MYLLTRPLPLGPLRRAPPTTRPPPWAPASATQPTTVVMGFWATVCKLNTAVSYYAANLCLH